MIDIGLGFSELIVIFTIALIVVGPERLPGLVRNLGRFVGRARRMAQAMQYELERELDSNDIAGDAAGKTKAANSNVTAHPKYGQLPERARPDPDAPPEDPLDDEVPTEGHADDLPPSQTDAVADGDTPVTPDQRASAAGADRSG